MQTQPAAAATAAPAVTPGTTPPPTVVPPTATPPTVPINAPMVGINYCGPLYLILYV